MARRATLYTERGPASAGRQPIPGTPYYRSARASREASRLAKGHEPKTVEQYARERKQQGKPANRNAAGPHVVRRPFRFDLDAYTVNTPTMPAVVRALKKAQTDRVRISMNAKWEPQSPENAPILAGVETPLSGTATEGHRYSSRIDRMELLLTAEEALDSGQSVDEWLSIFYPPAFMADIHTLTFEEV